MLQLGLCHGLNQKHVGRDPMCVQTAPFLAPVAAGVPAGRIQRIAEPSFGERPSERRSEQQQKENLPFFFSPTSPAMSNSMK